MRIFCLVIVAIIALVVNSTAYAAESKNSTQAYHQLSEQLITGSPYTGQGSTGGKLSNYEMTFFKDGAQLTVTVNIVLSHGQRVSGTVPVRYQGGNQIQFGRNTTFDLTLNSDGELSGVQSAGTLATSLTVRPSRNGSPQ